MRPGDKLYDWEDVDFDTNHVNPGAKSSGVFEKVKEYRNGFGETFGAWVTFDDGDTSVLRGTLLVERSDK